MAKKATKTTEQTKASMCCGKSPACCFASTLIGVGIGALIFNSIFSLHPVKWGLGLILVGALFHLYPKIVKK